MEGGNQKKQKIALLLSLNHMLGCSRCQWQVYMLFRSGQCKHFSRCSCTQDKWTVLSTCLVSIAEVSWVICSPEWHWKTNRNVWRQVYPSFGFSKPVLCGVGLLKQAHLPGVEC